MPAPDQFKPTKSYVSNVYKINPSSFHAELRVMVHRKSLNKDTTHVMPKNVYDTYNFVYNYPMCHYLEYLYFFNIPFRKTIITIINKFFWDFWLKILSYHYIVRHVTSEDCDIMSLSKVNLYIVTRILLSFEKCFPAPLAKNED